MEIWQFFLIIGTLFAALVSFIWMALKISSIHSHTSDLASSSGGDSLPKEVVSENVNSAVNQAFTEDFREELRQRARQQFEKLIHENAMFLQQDVRVSAAQLDDFMKKEIVATLQQELAKHHETLNQTKQMLNTSMMQSRQELERSIVEEKEKRIKDLDDHLPEVVKKYVEEAIGNTINGDQQLALIVDSLNAKKAEIFEDIRRNG